MKKEQKEQVKTELLGLNEQFKDLFKSIDEAKEKTRLLKNANAEEIDKNEITNDYITSRFDKKTKQFDEEYTKKSNYLKILYNNSKIYEYILKYYNNKIEYISYLIAYRIESLINATCENMRDLTDFDKIIQELQKEKGFIFRYYSSPSNYYLSVALQNSSNYYDRYDYIKHYSNIFKSEWNGNKYITILKKFDNNDFEILARNINNYNENLTIIEFDVEKLFNEFTKIIELQEKQEKEWAIFKQKQEQEMKENDLLKLDKIIKSR